MSAPIGVLLLNQYFAPDLAPTAQLLGELGEDLAQAGMRVTAIASSARYAGNGARFARNEVWRGVRVDRIRTTAKGRAHPAGRALDYATFLLPAAARVAFRRRPDVVVCLSTPPLVAELGTIVQWRGARFVYKVEDLYPDVAFALGVIRERSVIGRALRRVSLGVIRRADAVVALDTAMAERLRAQGARRVEVIPNWADGARLRPDAAAGARFRKEHHLDGRFVVLYAGNHGLAHRFDTVVQAAGLLATREPRVVFLFVGDGPRRAEVFYAAAGSGTVVTLEYQPAERLNEMLNAADVHLVTVRDEVTGLTVPSKFAAALAVAKPVLLVGGASSPMAAEIASEDLGFACPHRAEEIADVVKRACDGRPRLAEIGEHCRRILEERYERRIATQRWGRLIVSVAGRATVGSADAD